jgi:hypothetical protein
MPINLHFMMQSPTFPVPTLCVQSHFSDALPSVTSRRELLPGQGSQFSTLSVNLCVPREDRGHETKLSSAIHRRGFSPNNS